MAVTDTVQSTNDHLEKTGVPVTPSEPDSLWHEAYTHPGVTAAVAVGTVLAGAGLLYASRGMLGLGRTGTLLIEDTPFMGKAMKQVLEEQGHAVTWLTGVTRVEPFTGVTADGGSVVLNLKKFKTAFVDGELSREVNGKMIPYELQGENIVAPLKSKGVFSIGTSSVDKINADMLTNGADAAANKGVLFTTLVNRQVDFTGSLRAPVLQARLDGLGTTITSDAGKPLRAAADTVLKKFF